MNNAEYEALAERILHSMIRKNSGYTPPKNAHMLVDSALAVTDDFVAKLEARREQIVEEGALTREEIGHIRNGNAIHAIKLVRERLGVNLKEAKSYVDKAREELGL
jgi:hypothetical protein